MVRVLRVIGLLLLAALGFCMILTLVSCLGGTDSRDDAGAYIIIGLVCGVGGLFSLWLAGKLDD